MNKHVAFLRNAFSYCRNILLFLSFLVPSYGAESYGLGIDDTFWGQSPEQRGLRTVLLDINTQRVIEVNHYTPQLANGRYILNQGEHPFNPIRGFILDGTTDKKIIVTHEFNLERYTVISQFQIYRLKNPTNNLNELNLATDVEVVAPTGEAFNGQKRTYAKDRSPHKFAELLPLFANVDRTNQYITYSPTFRLMDMTGQKVSRVSPFQEEAFEEGGKPTNYSLKKEELGEISAILTIASYGNKFIYDTKVSGIFGFDLVFATGDNPSLDELFIGETKWTSSTKSPESMLEEELNASKIIDRIKGLKNKTDNTRDALLGLALIEKYFKTPGSKIFKMLYKVFDKNDRNNRGTARPCIVKIEESDRINIAEKVGFVTVLQNGPQLPNGEANTIVKPMANLAITLPVPQQVDVATFHLREFVNLLTPQYTDEILRYLREKYPTEYQKYYPAK